MTMYEPMKNMPMAMFWPATARMDGERQTVAQPSATEVISSRTGLARASGTGGERGIRL